MIQGFEKLNMGVFLHLLSRPVVAWPQSATVFKCIALLTSEKLNKSNSPVINFIQCKLSFSILRSTI